jgi:hypothetical protein
MSSLVLSVLLALFVGRELGKIEVRYTIRKGMRAVHDLHFGDDDDDDDWRPPQWNEDQL